MSFGVVFTTFIFYTIIIVRNFIKASSYYFKSSAILDQIPIGLDY